MATDSFEPPPQEIRAEFKTRVVNAWRSYQCCRNAHQRSRNHLYGVALFLEAVYEATPRQALVPGPSKLVIERVLPEIAPVFKYVAEWSWPAFKWGFTVSYMAGEIDPALSSLVEGLAQLDPQGKACRALVEITRDKRIANCYRCTKRNLLFQKKKRERVKVHSKWLPDDLLMIRTPHH